MMHKLHNKVQTKRKIADFSKRLFELKDKINLLHLHLNDPLILNLVKLSKLCNIPFSLDSTLKLSAVDDSEGAILTTFKDTIDSSDDLFKEKMDHSIKKHQKYAIINMFANKSHLSINTEKENNSPGKVLNTAEIFEYWKSFKTVFYNSVFVSKEIKAEKIRLANSIMNLGISENKEHEMDLVNQ